MNIRFRIIETWILCIHNDIRTLFSPMHHGDARSLCIPPPLLPEDDSNRPGRNRDSSRNSECQLSVIVCLYPFTQIESEIPILERVWENLIPNKTPQLPT